MMIKLLHYAKNNHFAILHTHCRPFSVYRFASLISPLPVAATVHDLLHYPGYRLLPAFQQFSNIHLISISLAQQRSNPAVKFAGNVYNGVVLSLWPFSPVHKGYLLFAGRLLKEKGVDLAVQIARASNLPLKIAGTLYPSRRRFFEAKIKPYLNDKIAYLGAVPREELPKLYGGALALLAPIRWPEPFGLIFIEAMCTGTPVVATSLGAAPEIIKDGETGFLLPKPKIDHFVEAIGKIDRISRAACRNHVQKNFTIAQTARNYLALYRKFI
jgi:glycosyltransferase involved in cell wall biosynthesis